MNKQLRTLFYSATLVISQLIAVLVFIECYHGSGFGHWVCVTLSHVFHEPLRIFFEIVSLVIAMIFAGLLFFMIVFRSGFSRWLKNTLLRIFPDEK